METPVAQSPILIYTEQTPNPESLKFVTNRMLYKGTADFREAESAESWSPLATALFQNAFVKGVYISNNFVTVTKEINYDWAEIMLRIKEFLKNWVESGQAHILDGYAEAQAAIEAQAPGAIYHGDEAVIVQKIKDLIETYVKPAVEMDGGNIEFKSFNQGVVNVILQGSCSGCPSSTVTLKSGIEGMLKRMVPEVTEVVSEMG